MRNIECYIKIINSLNILFWPTKIISQDLSMHVWFSVKNALRNI